MVTSPAQLGLMNNQDGQLCYLHIYVCVYLYMYVYIYFQTVTSYLSIPTAIFVSD